MAEYNFSSQETGMSLEAQKFEATKGKINLSYADRLKGNQAEYEEYYSGVCDVDDPEVARAMAEKLREYRKDPNRKIMIGVMTHPIVLDPEIPVHQEVREAISEEFPKAEDISKGFTDDPDVLNTIHYADLYGPNGPRKAGESQNVLKNLERCVACGGENLHAIQLDLTWPKPEEIEEFKTKHPNISIILQVGKFALGEVDNDPQDVADKLREYGDSIDFALLDLSMGKGVKMDSSGLLRLLSLIQYELPNLGLAVAGGLGPDSVDLLKPIADEFPNISYDAQGGVKPDDAPRDSLGHLVATTPADLEKTEEYLKRGLPMLDNKQNTSERRNNKFSYIRP